jgi:tetratricopeptide (TPR) repeat protein
MAHDLRASYGVEHYFDAPLNALALADTVRLLLLGEPAAQEPPPLSRAAEVHWNAAMEAFHRGDIDQAIAELERGTEREPQTFELQYHLGLLYGRREDLFAAIARLELALQMQPRHFLASKNLAAVCQRAGLPLRALDAWQRAMSVAPDDEARVNIKEHVVSLL